MATLHIPMTMMAALRAKWSISVAPVDGLDMETINVVESPDGHRSDVYMLPAGGGDLGPLRWVANLVDDECHYGVSQLLSIEFKSMAREAGILGACSVYEWCEQAQTRFTARGVAIDVRPINSSAPWRMAKTALEALAEAGAVVRRGAGLYEAVAT